MSGLGYDELRVGGYLVSNLVQISEGGFGLIYSCSDSRGGTYALKKCSVQSQESFNIVQKEVSILKRFKDSQYFVKILGENVSMQSGEAFVLLEMCQGGHLLDKLNQISSSGSIYGTAEICATFSQVLSAMTLLHTCKPRFIVHRDIKCENVLFGASPGNPMCAKLCDLARV